MNVHFTKTDIELIDSVFSKGPVNKSPFGEHQQIGKKCPYCDAKTSNNHRKTKLDAGPCVVLEK